MKRLMAIGAASALLALAPMGAAAQSDTDTDTEEYLEQQMIQQADTPAEHEALAHYFGLKAAEANALADRHRAMGRRYAQMPRPLPAMKQHCDRLVELNQELAAEYVKLAAEHERLSKGEAAGTQE